jgi:regulator of replication initiation timing
MELRMLKETKQRETAKIQSVAESAATNSVQLEAQRDALLAKVQDLERQLAAAVADVGVAHSDTQRVLTANANLQHALEAFQSEREAELSLMDEQRLSAEKASVAAHAATMEATHAANEAHVREIRAEFDQHMDQVFSEVKGLEQKNERLCLDNVQMRRSLDEAIQRLQATQEDVIDRAFMKNILLDWLTKPGAKERRQVLEVMANLLNFSEHEKDRVHIDADAATGALGRVVGTVAAPLPPSKADVEHLEGDNVREKWVNFLLAETDD